MKKLTYPLIAAVAGILIASAGQARAGGTDACCADSCCDDGIAASPKVRATLNERCASRCVTPTHVAVKTTTSQTDTAASPRVQRMRSEKAAVPAAVLSTESAGYSSTGPDGITASPKVRAQLNERAPSTQIAPLK